MFLLPHVVPAVCSAGSHVPPTPVVEEAPAHVKPVAQRGFENAPHAEPAGSYGSHTLSTTAFQMQAWSWAQLLVVQELPAAGGGAHVPHVE
jgi:hypothetical protein